MRHPKTVVLMALVTAGVLAMGTRSYWETRFNARRLAQYHQTIMPPPDLSAGILFYEKKIHRGGENPLDLAQLAGFYVAQGRESGDLSWYDRAETLAKRSLVLLPIENTAAQLTLAQVAEARHQFHEALRIAETVSGHAKAPGAGLGVMVTSNLALGETVLASQAADALAEASPGLGSFSLRALAYLAQGRDEEAVYDFRRSLEVEDVGEGRESAWVRSLFARYEMTIGKYAEAESLLREALRIVPGYHLSLALLGELETAMGDYSNAEKDLMSAFSASKQIPYLRFYAEAKAAKGDLKGAEQVRAQAEKLIRPELTEGKYGHRVELAQLLLEGGQPGDVNEALRLTEEEMKERGDANTLWVRATALRLAGKAKGARDTIQQLLRTGVHDPRYYLEASHIEEANHNLRRAGFYLGLALKTNPRFQPARHQKVALEKEGIRVSESS